MGRLFSIWGYISRYKYVAATLVFLLILGVLDENSLWVRFQRRSEIATLRREIDKYETQYTEETVKLEALRNDPAAVERMAREVYLMKRPNEDVYVFRDVEPSQIQSRKHKPAPSVESAMEQVVEVHPATDSTVVAGQ